MKRAFLLVLLTAAPACAGGWPWSRCEYPKFQSEYCGPVSHWQPVVASRLAWQMCEDESKATVEADRLALSFSAISYLPPAPAASQPARATLPAPAPAPPVVPVSPK
jgi:hypothetical protein